MAFNFEKLEVWQKAILLNKNILEIVKNLPNDLRYTIGSNLIRASLSVSNNIAEGSGRKGSKEANNFYNISKGSVYEVVNVLIILEQEKLLSNKMFIFSYNLSEEIAKMLSGLIKSNHHEKRPKE